ncbi:hypothetical protein [Jatrophihabitans lederbergiae]|uniref:Uncharacterized protein n=1 Tax=Jatrophihabitans lederbergiae TaxID=3075547 RepID=A0ABU2JEB3_9ACTN|nr:hypothetical protein [Jatrophihabitans sp. DSM 44399]MDT0263321.1 hypothetical protein [Jatrophihabitans sp. DSM 44399]
MNELRAFIDRLRSDGGGRKTQHAYPPAAVRYYVDADVLGLAKLLV